MLASRLTLALTRTRTLTLALTHPLSRAPLIRSFNDIDGHHRNGVRIRTEARTLNTMSSSLSSLISLAASSASSASSSSSSSSVAASSLLHTLGPTFSLIAGTSLVTIASILAFVSVRYHVASPNERLVKTGMFVDGPVAISMRTVQWPFQSVSTIKMNSKSYQLTIDKAMSKENIQFVMPVAFIISPAEDNQSLMRYATKLSGMTADNLNAQILAVVAGACRSLVGKLLMEQLFSDRDAFKQQVIEVINEDLDQFGLHIITMNIEELDDMQGSHYFKDRRTRALEAASNKAKVDIAEKLKEGDIGQKIHQGETRMRVAEVEKDAVLRENLCERATLESNKDRNVAKANLDREQREAESLAEQKTLEYTRAVEESRRMMQEATLRAQDLSVANVRNEVLLADAQTARSVAVARAQALASEVVVAAQAEADRIKLISDAGLYASQNDARGVQARAEAEAAGVKAKMTAEAEGMAQQVLALGGAEQLNRYVIVSSGQLQKIAGEQAAAMNGMKPTLNIWQTADGAHSNTGLTGFAQDMIKISGPFLDGLKQTTGVDLRAITSASKHNNIVSANSTGHDKSIANQ